MSIVWEVEKFTGKRQWNSQMLGTPVESENTPNSFEMLEFIQACRNITQPITSEVARIVSRYNWLSFTENFRALSSTLACSRDSKRRRDSDDEDEER